MSAYSVAVLADAPDVYYRLDEASGTTVADSSGNAHTLTANATISGSTPSLLSQDADTAITFDYTANAPTYASAAYTVSQDSMTVEFWINPNSLTTSTAVVGIAVDCSGAATGWSVYFNHSSGQWNFAKQGTGVAVFGASVDAAVGVTQHMVFVVKAAGGTVDLYQDGVFSENVATGGSMIATTGGFKIANIVGNTHNIKAVIDEVAIYKSELSAGRILAHYNAATVAASSSGAGRRALLGVGA